MILQKGAQMSSNTFWLESFKNAHWSIDSTKIIIPVKYVDIHEPELYKTWHKAKYSPDDGEFLEGESIKENSFLISSQGAKTRYAIKAIGVRGDFSIRFDHLVIGLNSKIALNHDLYFSGITHRNFFKFFKCLLSQGVFSVRVPPVDEYGENQQNNFLNQYKIFLDNARATDTDFKKDFILSDMQTYFYSQRERTLLDSDNRAGASCDVTSKKAIVAWGHREKANNEFPYLKYYGKKLELLYHSDEFAQKLDMSKVSEDLCRVEFTIKSKKMFGCYIKPNFDNNLRNVLELTNNKELLHNALLKIRSKHLRGVNMPKRKIESNNFTKPADLVLLGFVDHFILQGKPFSEVLKIAFTYSGSINKQSKHHWRTKLESMYLKYCSSDQYKQHPKDMESYNLDQYQDNPYSVD
jgi:hypothetical protein